MKKLLLLNIISTACTALAQAPSSSPDTRFKLATFEAHGVLKRDGNTKNMLHDEARLLRSS